MSGQDTGGGNPAERIVASVVENTTNLGKALDPGAIKDRMVSTHSGANALIIMLIVLVGFSFAGVGLFATHRMAPPGSINSVAASVLSPVQAAGRAASNALSQSVHTAFTCKGGKWIDALFAGTVVNLSLSDGRSFSLPATLSTNGTRFSNPDGSFIFDQSGNTASIEENGATTYASCSGV